MKQKHGKFKGFQKRFFVLYDEELRYYKTQVHYCLKIDSHVDLYNRNRMTVQH